MHKNWREGPFGAGWELLIKDFFLSRVGLDVQGYLSERLEQGADIYPEDPLRVLRLLPLTKIKVVILGQDPYHGEGQAQGLAFSVANDIKCPPSLRNIKKELSLEFNLGAIENNDLIPWVEQGVLLLNTILTVEAQKPASHQKLGWEYLTDQLIKEISEKQDGVVFMLWGKYAQSKEKLIDESKHLVLKANHPSPLSATKAPIPFIGCRHFELANDFLCARDKGVIHWDAIK